MPLVGAPVRRHDLAVVTCQRSHESVIPCAPHLDGGVKGAAQQHFPRGAVSHFRDGVGVCGDAVTAFFLAKVPDANHVVDTTRGGLKPVGVEGERTGGGAGEIGEEKESERKNKMCCLFLWE